MADWPGQKSRNRGQLYSGTSRSGRGFYYGGTRTLLMDEPGTELVWAGEGIEQFSEDVLEAVFSTLGRRGEDYMASRTPVDTGELLASIFVVLFAAVGRYQLNVGAEAEHSLFVELGTSKMKSQPFIRPTLDMLATLVPRVLQQEARARGA